MSENLRRGFGRKLIYRKEEIFALSRNWKSLEDSEPDYLYYWDSDNGFYHEAVKIETRSEGLVPEDYNIRKISYRYFVGTADLDVPQEVLNGYEIPAIVDSKEKVYEIGHILPVGGVVVVRDSDGTRIWQKASGSGSQKTDFSIRELIIEPKPNLKEAKAQYTLNHQRNQNFSMTDYTGFRLTLLGEELVDNKVTGFRYITHGDFKNLVGPVVQIYNPTTGDVVDVESFAGATVNSSVINGGTVYQFIRDHDSDGLIMNMGSNLPNFSGYVVRFARQSGDSEVNITSDLFINPKEVQYPKTPATGDSDIIEAIIPGTFPQWHPNNEPWRAFSDSDNDGFKASTGTDNGIIGINKNNDFGDLKILTLKRAHFRNPLATPAPNRPYNFRIQTFNPKRNPQWQIIHTESQFKGYSFTKYFDSEDCTRVRFVFDACQPEFNPAVNALEVGKIEFDFEEKEINIGRKNVSFFVANPETDYTFTITDSELVDVHLVSGGGGGGGGYAGAGGCGGSSVIAENVTLLPGTYALRCGAGGAAGPKGPDNEGGHNATAQAPSGGASYLRDVTRNKWVVHVGGSEGGDGTFLSSAGNLITQYSTTGGNPGELTFDSELVGNISRWNPGQPGGLGATYSNFNYTNAQNGGEGSSFRFKYFSSATNSPSLSNGVFGSGGGGGGYFQGAIGTGGTNAGTPSPTAGVRNADDGYAGGGGGGWRPNSTITYAPGSGGDGYAYITFVGNK